MKKFIIKQFSYVYNLINKSIFKQSNANKISVHRRRDLDALGEYIKI